MLASVALRTMGSRRRSGLAFEGARAQPPVSGGALADLALGSGRNARTTAELMGHMHMTSDLFLCLNSPLKVRRILQAKPPWGD